MAAKLSLRLLKRISAMRADEIKVRVRQEFAKHTDLALARLGSGEFSRGLVSPFPGPGKFFFDRQGAEGIVDWLRSECPDVVDQTVEYAEQILRHRFDLLGYENVDYGRDIDWHFDAVHGKRAPQVAWFRVPYLEFTQVGDHKIIWELNRHQHLVTLAKAYRLTGASRYTKEIFRQWYDWQHHNPYPYGINWASSLEVAFRSLSWLWTWYLLDGSGQIPEQFAVDLHRALLQNGRHLERYLSTYFAPNTHLLGEALALFFIGLLAPTSANSKHWQELGWQIVLQQAQKQVLSDGMHFEQSTYYHVYALDLFLHARILAGLNGIEIPKEFDRTIENMLEALCALCRSGPIPQFGDDDGGRVFDGRRNRREHMSDPLPVGAVLFNRADFKQVAGTGTEEMLWLLGKDGAIRFNCLGSAQRSFQSFALPASGIHVMSHPAAKQEMIIDCGPQGTGWAGHGHADALSIQLSLENKPVMIDPGTCTYVDVQGERSMFRETACHNTVLIDDESQAEPAGLFKWNSLAHSSVERWVVGGTFDFFAGSHAGYSRLSEPVVHRRFVFYVKSSFWLIRDVLEGDGAHTSELCWNFAPGRVAYIAGGVQYKGDTGVGLHMLCASNVDHIPEIVQGWYSPVYGRKEPSPVVRVKANSRLPIEYGTVLVPGAARGATLESIQAQRGERIFVRGYRYCENGTTHEMFFSKNRQDWQSGRISTDASFAYCGFSPAGVLNHFVLCEATYLKVDGERIFASDVAIAKAEWCASGEHLVSAIPLGSRNLRRTSILDGEHQTIGSTLQSSN